jgi:ABC-type glycerol-3-phosphate transport system substrate-binding protein
MIAVGSWIVPEVQANYPDLEIGFFPLPPVPGVERRTPKAVGGAFQISNKSEKKELALEFLDYLVENKEPGKIWLTECDLFPPVKSLDYSKYVSGVKEDIANRLSKPLHAFNLYGVLPREVNDYTWNAIQSMWDGEMTPEEIAKEKQELWKKAIEDGRVFK